MNKPCAIDEHIARYANLFFTIGTEPRFRIVQHLLSVLPFGLTLGELQRDGWLPGGALLQHLDKLKLESLVCVSGHGARCRFTANPARFEKALGFLYAECCTRTWTFQSRSS